MLCEHAAVFEFSSGADSPEPTPPWKQAKKQTKAEGSDVARRFSAKATPGNQIQTASTMSINDAKKAKTSDRATKEQPLDSEKLLPWEELHPWEPEPPSTPPPEYLMYVEEDPENVEEDPVDDTTAVDTITEADPPPSIASPVASSASSAVRALYMRAAQTPNVPQPGPVLTKSELLPPPPAPPPPPPMTAGAKLPPTLPMLARVVVAAKAEAKKAQDAEWDDVMDAWRSNEVASFSAPVVQDVQPSDKVKKEKSPKATLAVAENTASAAASVNRKKKKKPPPTLENLGPAKQQPDEHGLVWCRYPNCGVQLKNKKMWSFCKPHTNLIYDTPLWSQLEELDVENKEVLASSVALESLRPVMVFNAHLVHCRWPNCPVQVRYKNYGVFAFCKPHFNKLPEAIWPQLDEQYEEAI